MFIDLFRHFLSVRHLSSPRLESDMSTQSIDQRWQQLVDQGGQENHVSQYFRLIIL